MILDFSLQDIIDQCNVMVYLNVLSFCMLSGCGNIELPQESELEKIYSMISENETDKKPVNVFFMSSLYRRGIPNYVHIPSTPYDFSSFQWLHKKMKKTIKPDILAYSISCLAKLANKIRNDELKIDNKDFIHYCVLTSAAKQALFARQYLKLGDLYYSGEDIGENSYGEYHIEILPNEANLISQFLMLEAFSELLNSDGIDTIVSGNQLQGIESEIKTLGILCSNLENNINTIKSRDLAIIALSLENMYAATKYTNSMLYNILNIIGCELYERLYENGDIARNVIDRESSSFITLCNCLNCFSKLYTINKLDMYNNAVHKIYDRIDSFWNDNTGLFIKIDDKKSRYTIKDIGYIISALKTFKDNTEEIELRAYAEKQFSAFFRSAVINSKIFNNQSYPILQDSKIELHNLGSISKNTAPIFYKEFTVKHNKRKYSVEVGVYRPEYILCGCKFML